MAALFYTDIDRLFTCFTQLRDQQVNVRVLTSVLADSFVGILTFALTFQVGGMFKTCILSTIELHFYHAHMLDTQAALHTPVPHLHACRHTWWTSVPY